MFNPLMIEVGAAERNVESVSFQEDDRFDSSFVLHEKQDA